MNNSDGTSLRRQGLAYLVANLIQRGLPVAAIPLLTRVLDTTAVGEVAVALAVANVASILLSFGLNFSIVRLFHDSDGQQPRATWMALTWIQTACSTAVVVAVLVALWTVWTGPERSIALWTVVLGWALSVQTVLLGVARTTQRVRLFVVMTALQAIGGQALGIALALEQGSTGYVAGVGLGTVSGAVAGHVVLRVPLAWRVQQTRMVVGFSGFFMANWLSIWALSLSDRLLIERLLGVEHAGRYFVAYVIGTGLFLILDAVQSAWVPRYYARKDRHKVQLLRRSVVPATVLAGQAGLLVALGAPLFLTIADPRYTAEMVVVVVLVSLTATLRPAYLVATAVLGDNKDTRSMATASFLTAGLSVLANLALLPRVGISGAAIATVATFAIQAQWCLVRARRYAPVPAVLFAQVGLVWLAFGVATLSVVAIPAEGSWVMVRAGVALLGAVLLLQRLRTAIRLSS